MILRITAAAAAATPVAVKIAAVTPKMNNIIVKTC